MFESMHQGPNKQLKSCNHKRFRDLNDSLQQFKAAFNMKTILQPKVMVSFFVHVYEGKVNLKKVNGIMQAD